MHSNSISFASTRFFHNSLTNDTEYSPLYNKQSVGHSGASHEDGFCFALSCTESDIATPLRTGI